MRVISVIVFVALVAVSASAQSVGDYGSNGTGGGNWGTSSTWVVCATAGTWTGATAAASAPSSSKNVWIRTGDVVTVDASGKTCKNLTIQSGATLQGNATLPTSSIVYVRIYGATVQCDGKLGSSATDNVSLEFLSDVTLQGSGSVNLARIRPNSGFTGPGTFTFAMSANINYAGTSGTGGAGIYSGNGSADSITFTINAGDTVSFAPYSYFATSSSTSSNGTATTTFNINGVVNLTYGHMSLICDATHTATLNVGGTLNVGRNLMPFYTGGNVATMNVLSGGVLNILGTGTADFSNASAYVSGAGTFSLSSGAHINVAAAAGLDPTSGPVRTTTRTFSTGSDYYYVGTAAQSTGSDLPATIDTLAINNANGVSLDQSVNVSGALIFTSGRIRTGANTLTAIATNISGGGLSNFVDGNMRCPVTSIGSYLFPTGQGTDYLPATINFTALTGTGSVVVSVVDGSATPPTPAPGISIKALGRYFHVTKDAGITALSADVTLSYADADVAAAGIATDTTLNVYGTDGVSWIQIPVVARDTTNNTLKISSVNSFSDYVIGIPGVIGKVVTISEARKDANGDLIPDYSVTKDTLILYGVVTSPNYVASAGGTSYYVQDGTAGIDIYRAGTVMNFNIGDSVIAVGTVLQYRGLTELQLLAADSVHFGLLKKGAAVPKPKIVTISDFLTNAETYEGQLVQVNSLTKSSGTWPAANSNASLYFKGLTGTDSVQIFIDKDTDIDGSTEPQYPVGVVGIVSQYTSSSSVYNDGYELLPRDTTDFVAAGKVVTIAEARKDANGDLIPDYSITKDTLIVYGVVTSPNYVASAGGTSYYIQDATAGIDIYRGGTVMNFDIGDSVIAIGTILQYRGLTELQLLAADSVHFGLLKKGAVVPKPKVVTVTDFLANAETYEGQLVQIDTLYKSSGNWPADGSNMSVYFKAQSGTDSVQIFIDKDTNIDGSVEPEYPVNVTGVVSQYTSSSTVYNDGYEVLPRDTSDFVHFTIVAVNDRPNGIPKEFYMKQNYPNPFNPSTTIEFGLPKEASVQVAVYNVLGQRVALLVDGAMKAGNHQFTFNADRLASGVYFYVMRAGNQVFKQKMLLMK